MSQQEQGNHEQKLLVMYRTILKAYLQQQRMWEGTNVPEFLETEISLIRRRIMNLKGTLRSWKTLVFDDLDDEASEDEITDEIEHQRELLQIYRERLAIYLKQQQQFDIREVPIPIINSITDSRWEIQRIKAILRAWNVPVEDLPEEES